MTATALRTYPDTYVDSVLLMEATRRMGASPGTEWAAAVMGTPANVAELTEAGFSLPPTRANDLVLAVRAASDPQADAALEAGHVAVTARPQGGAGAAEAGQPARPGSLEEALAVLPDANVAIVSVPGPYAALEAHKALSAGLHVLLFSDNVPVADEIELKERAVAAGRLLMGPGAGTAMLGGTGLGFANAVRPGRVGVVAAAGTGAQEVMTLLDRWGEGVSQAIGVGGRDLSAAVGGTMTRFALSLLDEDAQTEAILLVSKPPSPGVAAGLLSAAPGKPLTAALIGLAEPIDVPPGVTLAGTLDEAVIAALAPLGRPVEDPGRGLAELAATGAAGLAPARTAVVGLFSGGTLCYESMVVMSRRLGP
ncbi:MAG TPA: protein FdrA, partial [Actinomycetota bacterium]|nr:protein FdrA [Actinomycetota bacterium]